LKNFTFLGIQNFDRAKKQLRFGNRWRRASSMNMTNSIIAGYDIGAVFENITVTGSVFSNNVIHAYSAPYGGDSEVPGTGNITHVSDNAEAFLKFSRIDIFYVTSGMSDLYNPSRLRPSPDSPAYGDGETTFKGAFHPSQQVWTAGWTEFNPKFY
jgi:hypothetical protein